MLANTVITNEEQPPPTEIELTPEMVGNDLKRALKRLKFQIVGEVEGGYVWERPDGILFIQSCFGVTQMGYELVFN